MSFSAESILEDAKKVRASLEARALLVAQSILPAFRKDIVQAVAEGRSSTGRCNIEWREDVDILKDAFQKLFGDKYDVGAGRDDDDEGVEVTVYFPHLTLPSTDQ